MVHSRMSNNPNNVCVLLALGSNVGNPMQNLKRAIGQLQERFNDIVCSRFYRSQAMYETDQSVFFNAAVMINTHESPEDLLRIIKDIERQLGRIKTYRFGPRIIDIDIIYYGGHMMQTKELTIPHGSRLERSFVLQPLNDIAPDFIDPHHHVSLAELANALGEQNIEVISDEHDGLA